MSSDLALSVEQLSKLFPIYKHPRDRLIQAVWGRRKKLYHEFWALKDISFRVNRGQTLGIVGRNGSGKSTLLQLICGTLTPTAGKVEVNGRIAALLELGSGFNPEFTGLENIYLNGTLLGLKSKEIDSKLDEILKFADIGDFINQPVKTYSSGMAVRLAFAVQAHVQPDLLVVDEALSVGDEMFQKKCYTHIEKLKEKGTAILLVTHNCQQVLEQCDQALLLSKGQLKLQGSPKLITVSYQRLNNAPMEDWESLLGQISAGAKDCTAENIKSKQELDEKAEFDPNLLPNTSIRYEAHGVEIEAVEVLSKEGLAANQIPFMQQFSIRFLYRATKTLEDLQMACNISNQTGIRITGQQCHGPICSRNMLFSLTFHFDSGLLPGVYFIGGGIWQEKRPGQFIHRIVDACALRITHEQPIKSFGVCDLSISKPTLEELSK